MSIHSLTFGGVTLSGKDAKKFKNQVRYGKPKAAASASIKRGVKLSRKFKKSGRIVFVLKSAKVKVAS